MSYFFALHEIPLLAMSVEERGMSFYSGIAETVDDRTAKDTFMTLARQEGKHRDMLHSISDELKEEDSSYEFTIDFKGVVSGMINDLAQVMFDNAALGDRTNFDAQQALEIALSIEIRTVDMYNIVRGSLSDRFAPVLDRIIEEEKAHVQIIRNVKTKLGYK